MRDLLHEIFSGYSIEEQELAFGGKEGHSTFNSALDALFDSEEALRNLRQRKGKLPLLSIMGVFVALRNQQDALRRLSIILGDPISLIDETNPDGMWIRKLANNIIHPIPKYEKKKNKTKISTFFPANMNDKNGFVVAFYGSGPSQIIVNYDELLERHNRSIDLVREKIVIAAEAKELELHEIRPIDMYVGGKRIVRNSDESYRAFRNRINSIPRPALDLR